MSYDFKVNRPITRQRSYFDGKVPVVASYKSRGFDRTPPVSGDLKAMFKVLQKSCSSALSTAKVLFKANILNRF